MALKIVRSALLAPKTAQSALFFLISPTALATLVRQELRLAQAEGSEKISNAVIGVAAILGGLLIAACALLILLQALVIALANHMPDWLAALVVGVAVAIVAFIAIWQGRRNLSMEKLAPRRTMRTVRESTEMVMEKAR